MPAPRTAQRSLLERFSLEEESEPDLHGSIACLLENSSKSRGGRVGVDRAEIGMIENVLRFHPNFYVSCIVAAKMDLLEQRSIGIEATRIPYPRK